MTFDFLQLNGTDFVLGAFGATLVEIHRLKQALDKNDGQVKASRIQWIVNIVWVFILIVGSGILAAVQGVSPLLSAFYAGLTSPVFFSVILRDNAKAEKELVQKIEEPKNKEIAFQDALVSSKDKKILAQSQEIDDLRTLVSDLENRLMFYSSRSQRSKSEEILSLVADLTESRDELSQLRREPLTVSSSEVRNDVREKIEYLTSRLLNRLTQIDRDKPAELERITVRSSNAYGSALEEVLQITKEYDANLEKIRTEKNRSSQPEKVSYARRLVSISSFFVFVVMLTVVYLLFPNGNVFVNFALGLSMSLISNLIYDAGRKVRRLQKAIDMML